MSKEAKPAMGGTKIMVVQMKEVIKSAVFVVAGLILIIMLIYFFIPKGRNSAPGMDDGTAALLYMPGTYSAQIVLNNEPVDVHVTLSEERIEDITIDELADSQELFYPLINPTLDELASEILATQSLEVADSSENVVTRQVLLDAIAKAVAQGEQ